MKKSLFGHSFRERETGDILHFYKEVFLSKVEDTPENRAIRRKVLDIPNAAKKLDPKCVLEINKRIIRVEYPGEVVNVDKALRTLGGVKGLELSVGDHRNKLKLNFHPENIYSKSVVADKDFKPGILLKVKRIPGDEKMSYEIVGINIMNFTFNRLYDFQYLPLYANPPETKSSPVEYLYNQIIPETLPDYEWLTKEESKNMPQFLVPVCFSRYDNAKIKFNVDDEGIEDSQIKAQTKRKKLADIFGKKIKQASYQVNFGDKEFPMKPTESCLKNIKTKSFEEQLLRAQKIFEERPIWTKAAVQHLMGANNETMKFILPGVAYYFLNGPFRVAWVRFGYDPRKDPNSKIYQTLDYRIRTGGTGETAQLKVDAKRSYRTTPTSLASTRKISLKDTVSVRPKLELDERYYILRPGVIPPARQMFYQYCDIMIPEVQDMLTKLPKIGIEKTCDPKTGWLPKSFIDKCREIVNNTILQVVQKELLEDRILQEKAKRQTQKSKTKDPTDYCSQMMSNIKKGIYKKVNLSMPGTSRDVEQDVGEDAELISLSSDDEDPMGEIIQNSIPENLEEEDDEEEESDANSESSDEPEIDMEAVEELNQILSELKK